MRPFLPALFVLSLAAAALAGNPAAERFGELSAGYRRDGPSALDRAREVLLAEYPDLFETALPPGPLRSDLARALKRDEVFALFARAARESDRRRERWTVLATNLSSREDLPALLAEMGVVAAMLPDDDSVLVPLAEAALLRGEPDLARALLADPRSTLEMAERLAASSAARALHLLADAAAGALPLPPEAAARLAAVSYFGEDLPARPLGAERTAGLLRTAETHEDPLRRVIAARILAASADPGVFPALLAACEAADGPALVFSDGYALDPRWLRFPPPAGGPLRFRLALLHGRLGSGEANADLSFEDAERLAAEARIWLAGEKDARLIGHFLRLLAWAGDFLVVHGELGRRIPVPSCAALLDDLATGRPAWPDDLAGLAHRVAERLRAQFAGEDFEPASSPARPVSPVAALIRSVPIGENLADIARRIGEWLALDPEFLFDPDCGNAIGDLGAEDRRRFVRAIPEEILRRLLARPPTRYRVKDGGHGDDLDGAECRDRLLRILGIHGERAVLLGDPDPVLRWPGRNRRQAGWILAVWTVHPARLGELLADDEFAFGYLSARLASGPGDLGGFAARVVAGVESRPALLAALADGVTDELYLGETLPSERMPPLEPALREALAARVRSAADPSLALLAGHLLAASGTEDDLAALLRNGEALGAEAVWNPHPLSLLVSLVDTRSKLALFLDYVAREDADPRARADIFSALARGDFLTSLDEEDQDAAREAFHTFARDRLPTLGRGVAEAGLIALLEERVDDEAMESVEAALAKVPVESVRIRLRIALEEYGR